MLLDSLGRQGHLETRVAPDLSEPQVNNPFINFVTFDVFLSFILRSRKVLTDF